MRKGHLDESTGNYITDDGKVWKSIGCVDFGNNNFFEVMVPEQAPQDIYTVFAGNTIHQFPVYLMSHDDGLGSLGLNLAEFMDMMVKDWPHHLTEVVIQLGHLLADYSKTQPAPIVK